MAIVKRSLPLIRLVALIPEEQLNALAQSLAPLYADTDYLRRLVYNALAGVLEAKVQAETAQAYLALECSPDWSVVETYFGLDNSFCYTDVQCVSYMADYLVSVDKELPADALDGKYNPEGDGEHPDHSRHTWRQAVGNEETLLGYWEWVSHQLQAD